MVDVTAEALRTFAADCYAALGVSPEASALVADTLVQADLWGHPSHGVMRLFWYAARLESGATSTSVFPEADGSATALSVLDGGDGLGQVVAHAAMKTAIAKAKVHGIGAIAARHSGHFGTAMYLTRMATQAGCIGFMSTNASPAMSPWGGREKRVGTNPWSWAAPAGRYPPMMLDVANTAVARGKLYAAKSRGETIPEGWAIDPDGMATTDPAHGIAGTILPMAGHKGYAITLMMDVLSGVLSGSAFGASIVGPYATDGRSGAGHLAIALDIESCRPLAAFEADMERLIAEVKATPRAAGIDEIFYPGELEARNDESGRENGISLPPAVVEDLRAGGERLGITAPF